MNSGELAGLAGVTVRTLRHYHQLGILPEPARAPNGYRRYDVQHLITVLRIRRLTSIGIALGRIPELVHETGDDSGQALDNLHRELSLQIDRLITQRDLVSQLRETSAPPELPPELARFWDAFAAARLSPAMVRMDRDATILLAHLVRVESMPQLVEFYRRMSHPGLLPQVIELSTRFAALGVDTSDEQLDELAADFSAKFGPIIAEFPGLMTSINGASTALLSDYIIETLSDPQRRAVAKINSRAESSK